MMVTNLQAPEISFSPKFALQVARKNCLVKQCLRGISDTIQGIVLYITFYKFNSNRYCARVKSVNSICFCFHYNTKGTRTKNIL